jgi:hypothetical protein
MAADATERGSSAAPAFVQEVVVEAVEAAIIAATLASQLTQASRSSPCSSWVIRIKLLRVAGRHLRAPNGSHIPLAWPTRFTTRACWIKSAGTSQSYGGETLSELRLRPSKDLPGGRRRL